MTTHRQFPYEDLRDLVVAIDPGNHTGGHIGLSLWLPGGIHVVSLVMEFEGLIDMLEELDIQVLVAERYMLDHRAAKQRGSRMEASQAIGYLKSLAHRKSITYVEQTNQVLKPAAMHAGITVAESHFRDDVAAKLHGFYYFESQGMRARDIQL